MMPMSTWLLCPLRSAFSPLESGLLTKRLLIVGFEDPYAFAADHPGPKSQKRRPRGMVFGKKPRRGRGDGGIGEGDGC